jgi:Co/Zn/Cd efflux system component
VDACCNKDSALAALRGRQRHTLIAVLIVNAAMFGAMVIAAWLSHSSALLSNSLDNLGDALTYALSLWAVGLGVHIKARVALFKAMLILGSALAVGVQIAWRLANPVVPIFETMGIFGFANIATNGLCLWLLTRHRHDDVNMASVYECSRNDVAEGVAVLAAAGGVAWFGSGWPDIAVATTLLLLFLRSGGHILGMAWRELRAAAPGGVSGSVR